jgi:hypothetical protein
VRYHLQSEQVIQLQLALVALVVLLIIKADSAMTQCFQRLHQMAVAVVVLTEHGLQMVTVDQVQVQGETLTLEQELLIKDTLEEKTLLT